MWWRMGVLLVRKYVLYVSHCLVSKLARRWFAMRMDVLWTANLMSGLNGVSARRAVAPGTGHPPLKDVECIRAPLILQKLVVSKYYST